MEPHSKIDSTRMHTEYLATSQLFHPEEAPTPLSYHPSGCWTRDGDKVRL
jgi:hypothetical protein